MARQGSPGIQVAIGSQDLIRQAETLRLFPEIADKYYLPAMRAMVQELSDAIRPNIPVGARGELIAGFSTKVSGHGLRVKGQVGWLKDGPYPWVNKLVHLVDQDVRPHEMNTYIPAIGVYIGLHPGHKGYQFMQKGLDAASPIIESVAGAANEAVVQELAIK